MKITTPKYGGRTEEPVAVFNRDSEAITFAGHLVDSGCETVIELDKDTVRYVKEVENT